MRTDTLSKTNFSKTSRMVGLAIMIAIVISLQMVASYVKFGPFSITLALVPIIIGSAMYGAGAGAVLGAAFGVVTLIMCINGIDPGGYILWAANPPLTAVLCLIKGGLAGYATGFIYEKIKAKNSYIRVLIAAIACPVVNTGVFLLALVFLYRDTLVSWAGDTNMLYYIITAIILMNFVPEFILNVALSPTVARIINISKKYI